MADWLAFSAVAGVLTLLLLLVARQSQQLLSDAANAESAPESPPTSDGVSAPDLPSSGGVGSQHDVDPPADAVESTESPESVEATEPAASVEATETAESVDSPDSVDTTPDPAEEAASADPTAPGPQPTPRQPELTPRIVLANVATTQGLLAGIVLGAAWFFEIPADAFGVTGDPWNSGLPAVALGLAFGVALWLGNEFATTVADAAGAAYDESVRELLAPDSTEGWVVLFVAVLPIIAFAEELLFRAALIGVPAAGFDISPWLLAVLASAAFALGHGAQGRVGVVVTGLLGFVLAAGYVLTGSLLVVIVAHYVINGLEFAVHEYAGIGGLFDSLVAGE